MRSVALALVLAGCRLGFDDQALTDPDAFYDPTPPADFTSGTRLRAIAYEVDNVPLQHRGWFDSQFDSECTVFEGEDGGQYCFPDRIGHFAQFSDPACTVPLMRVREPDNVASCPSESQVGYVETFPRSEIYRFATVGAQYTGVVYQNAGGPTCDMLTGNDGSWYSVASYRPLSELVSFTEEVVPAGPLGYVRQVASDGASYLDSLGFVEMATGERCELTDTLFTREVRCVPKIATGSLVYADASCTTRAVVTYKQPDATAVRVGTRGMCESTDLDVTVGTPLTTYYNLDGTCMPQDATGDFRAWTIADIQPSRSVAVGTLVTEGTTPITQSRWVFDTGHELPSYLFDRARNDRCYPISMEGTLELRCAPLWTGTPVSLFSDASCTASLFAWPSCAGTWRSTWFPGGVGEQTCDGISYFVYAFDTPYAQQAYWSNEGVCTPVPASVTVMTSSNTKYAKSEMVQLERVRK